MPLAFLVASRGSGWFRPAEIRPLDAKLNFQLSWILRATTSLLLVGHGLLAAVVQKPLLQHQLAAMGLPFVPLTAWGGFEIALGLAVLLNSSGILLLFVAAWKIGTELFYPLSGALFWEFIERGGSYLAPLALLLLSYQSRIQAVKSTASSSELNMLESLRKT